MYNFIVKDENDNTILNINHEKFCYFSIFDKHLLIVGTFFKNGDYVKQFEIYKCDSDVSILKWSTIQSKIANRKINHLKTYINTCVFIVKNGEISHTFHVFVNKIEL